MALFQVKAVIASSPYGFTAEIFGSGEAGVCFDDRIPVKLDLPCDHTPLVPHIHDFNLFDVWSVGRVKSYARPVLVSQAGRIARFWPTIIGMIEFRPTKFCLCELTFFSISRLILIFLRFWMIRNFNFAVTMASKAFTSEVVSSLLYS